MKALAATLLGILIITTRADVTNTTIRVTFDKYVSEFDNDLVNSFKNHTGFSALDSGIIVPPLTRDDQAVAYLSTKAHRLSATPITNSVEFLFSSSAASQAASGFAIVLSVSGTTANCSCWATAINYSPTGRDYISHPGNGKFIELTDGWYRLSQSFFLVEGNTGSQIRWRADLINLQSEVIEYSSENDYFDANLASNADLRFGVQAAQSGGVVALDNFTLSGPLIIPSAAGRIVAANIHHAIEIVWDSQSGKRYLVEQSDDAANPVWRAAAGLIQGNGAPMSLLLRSRERQSFFRVREED